MEDNALQVLHIEARKLIPPGLDRHITREYYVGDERGVFHKEVWIPANADPARTMNNIELVSRSYIDKDGLLKQYSLQGAVNARLKRAGIRPRITQSTSLEVIISGSSDVLRQLDRGTIIKWANKALAWAQKTWGKENVVSATLHLDESTPHIHLVVVPIVTGESRRTKYDHDNSRKGKHYRIDHTKERLCANEVFTRGNLYKWHDSLEKEVSTEFGLHRGIRAEPGSKIKHQTSEDHNRQLERERLEKERIISELTADYEGKKSAYEKQLDDLEEKVTNLQKKSKRKEVLENLIDIGAKVSGLFGGGAIVKAKNAEEEAKRKQQESERLAAAKEKEAADSEEARVTAENARREAERRVKQMRDDRLHYGDDRYRDGLRVGRKNAVEEYREEVMDLRRKLETAEENKADAVETEKKKTAAAKRTISQMEALNPYMKNFEETLKVMENVGLTEDVIRTLYSKGEAKNVKIVIKAGGITHPIQAEVSLGYAKGSAEMKVWFKTQSQKEWRLFPDLKKDILNQYRKLSQKGQQKGIGRGL